MRKAYLFPLLLLFALLGANLASAANNTTGVTTSPDIQNIFVFIIAAMSIVLGFMFKAPGFRMIFFIVGGIMLIVLATMLSEPIAMIMVGVFGGIVALVGVAEAADVILRR